MNNQEKLQQLAASIGNYQHDDGLTWNTDLIPGEVNVLQVEAQDREEFPIFITIDESQILCVTHLWKESEVKNGCREELLDALLTMNIPMPLSSFSKVGDQYILFGALANTSSIEDIAYEINTLSDNTLDAVEALAEYLN